MFLATDCGVFLCMFADCLSRDMEIDFTQADITRAGRQRIILANTEKKL